MRGLAKILKIIFLVVAIFCGLYFLFLEFKLGYKTKFNYVWLFLFFVSLAMYFLFQYAYTSLTKLPLYLKLIIEAVVFIGLFIFIVVEAIIVLGVKSQPDKSADYIIVLGAKVNGSSPSLILQYRIDAAYNYLNSNPTTQVIVSGGKGYDEDISEAMAMYNQLVNMGISKERIILEAESTNTVLNLTNSFKLIPSDAVVGIVSSDFHVYRATAIAKHIGYIEVFGIKAKSVWYLIPTNYAREFVGVMKDLIFGNMNLF